MSWISKAFGGKKKDEPMTPQDAIQQLRATEEMLNKKSDFLEKKVEQELTNAKRHGTKNKRLAIAALKRKKRFEKQLLQIDGTLSTLEFQREALENANTNTEVLKIMSVASKSLKAAHQNLDVDEVHNIMDDLAEQQEISEEISTAISNPIGFGNDVDETELERELEELEQEELANKLINATPAARDRLPSIPTEEPVTASVSRPARRRQADHDDEDMKHLAQWAVG
ncbi:charged multivesicular body protein 4b-like isoform X2 [Paramacrobiotus metropolitanus]|uniref:charged multivesicular body protein 4b-like isoform X2 n=1 Tax=Paramacrobiotus metropolitanus TaxID=2943436 RepID=UPI002446288C|nr:charged multivesicular body protein 4b-like isoform X2 [Paramacrobiotus metropolitanus]